MEKARLPQLRGGSTCERAAIVVARNLVFQGECLVCALHCGVFACVAFD